MSKMKSLGLIFASMMMADSFHHSNTQELREIDLTPKVPPIPKGCKVWNFDEVGNCLYSVNSQNTKFSCIAINEKSAIRKFSKWLNAEMKLNK